MNYNQILVMKQNKISTTLSNIMLSPASALFAIFLICSSHIFIKCGEARPYHHRPSQTTGRYITENENENENNNDYDDNHDSTMEAIYQQLPTSLSPTIQGANFVSRSGLRNPQRYNPNNNINNNHNQKFNPEQAISLDSSSGSSSSNSFRRTESTAEPLGLRKICPPNKPFQCPSDGLQGGECIPIQYLCNGFSDCPQSSNSQISSDENPRLCAAIRRLQSPLPVDSLGATTTLESMPTISKSPPSTNPLKANLLDLLVGVDHGPRYLGKLFVPRLFKRSGISDQRIAEIQMIRALKKQLERASNSSA